MKNFQKLLLLTVFLLINSVSYSQHNGFIFFDDSYENLKIRAKNADKPYFIYLYADWSTHAKKSNENTFNDGKLAFYAQNYYIGMKMNGEKEGKEISKELNILYHPVLVLFTPEGKEIERVYGYLEPNKLQAYMKEHRKDKGKFNGVAENPAAAVFGEEMDDEYNPKEDGYLLQVKAKVLPLKGFGVQIAVFEHYRTAFIKIIELSEKRFHENVLAYVNESGGKSTYKVVLGPFETEKEAESYRLALIEVEPDLPGIVVDLSTIE